MTDKSSICLITPGYPSNENLYNFGFVHTRVKEYIRRGFKVDVFVLGNPSQSREYIFEGVEVKVVESKFFKKILGKYPIIFVHFISPKIVNLLEETQISKKLVQIWYHGSEVLSFNRSLFEIYSGWLRFLKFVAFNSISRKVLGAFIKSHNLSNFRHIFPSLWLKEAVEKDLNLKIRNFEIIPNPIDLNFFEAELKSEDQRFNFLSIRSFSSYKYSTDILQRIILLLDSDPRFSKFKDLMKIEIYGDGKFFQKHTKKIKEIPNVKIFKTFLTHFEMQNVFSKNGILLCPTRLDAQGVTMCEAMACGLVPISSLNSAIPEFVSHGRSGFLSKSLEEYLDYALFLMDNPQKFLEMSKKAKEEIFEKCNIKKITENELSFIGLN